MKSKGASLRPTRNSVYGAWDTSARRIRRHANGSTIQVVFPKGHAFEEVPEGFSTLDDFVERFVGRAEIAALLPNARREIQASLEAGNAAVGLAGLRRRAGLSQSELAVKLNTSQPAISLYESGQREPSLSMIRALAEALGVSFDELVPALA